MSSNIITSSAKATPTTTPNFLARFPRSLSQLNIGNKRKSAIASPQEPQRPLPASPPTPNSSSSSSNTPISSPNHQQKVRVRHQHPTITADVPPPLPQRNIPRKNQISDLDASLMKSPSENLRSGGSKKKNKQKAYSDPKMSSEMMMQMEASNLPPPLPPRTPGGNPANAEDCVFVTNKDSSDGSPSGVDGRPLPNSCSTQLHYPLISTSVAVRDGMLPPTFHGHHHHQRSFDSVMNTSSSSLPPDLQAGVVVSFLLWRLQRTFWIFLCFSKNLWFFAQIYFQPHAPPPKFYCPYCFLL